MPYLHSTEKVHREPKLETLTVVVETKDFTFEAVGSKTGDVDIYVTWGDNQNGYMESWDSWAEARRHFHSLLSANEPVTN